MGVAMAKWVGRSVACCFVTFFCRLTAAFDTPPMPFVVSLAQDGAGRIWIGTEDHGVFRFDAAAKNAAAWTKFTTKDGLGDDNAYAICEDKLGRVWVGHLNHGVSVYNGQSWKNYDVLDGPIGERVFSVAADPVSGDIWIATSAGLTRYSVDHDKWNYITLCDGLPSDQIQSLAFDTRGTLYAGTQCDGFAIASGKDNYQRWKQIAGSDSVPLTPTGAGLPSNLINQVLVDRNGTVYVATTCGLAASKDGKRWSFVRGADWAAKVKGLYGGPPRGWRETKADFTLTEDYCTCLAEDDSGLLWVGHWRTGYEVIYPQQLQRVYQSTLEESGTPPPDKNAKPATPSNPAYVFTILPRSGAAPLIGWYGHGLTETKADLHAMSTALRGHDSVPSAIPNGARPGEFSSSDFSKVKPTETAKLPTPAAPPTLDELNIILADMNRIRSERAGGAVLVLNDDWRTQGDEIDRYSLCYGILWGMGGGGTDDNLGYHQSGFDARLDGAQPSRQERRRSPLGGFNEHGRSPHAPEPCGRRPAGIRTGRPQGDHAGDARRPTPLWLDQAPARPICTVVLLF